MAAIEVEDLTKDYPGVRALDGVSFGVERGEIMGLLGPNGAGKTTLLRILAGSLAPTAGTANLDGRDVVTDSYAVRQNLGYLPENAPLYPEMTPREYLDFMARVRHLRGGPDVDRAVERCGVGDVLDRPVGQLSKGYRQRVGLAQAILSWPPILLLDEPTSGLDPKQIAGIRELIQEIGRDRTVILSSHILAEVEATCDRVVIIESGRVRAGGTTAELADRVGRGRKLRVVVEGGEADDIAAALANIGGVAAADVVEGAISLTASQDVRARVFRLAVERGWTLLELRAEPVSLESVYLTLTAGGGDSREPGDREA